MEKSKNDESINIDTVLEELGTFGKYHAVFLLIMTLANTLWVMYGVDYIFIVEDVNYRCLVPECEESSSAMYYQTWAHNSSASRCQHYDIINDTQNCQADSFNTSKLVNCDSWVYERTDSFVHEFQLACQDYKRTIVGSLKSNGSVFALMLSGIFSDILGRKASVCIFSFFLCFFGLLKSFINSYITYLVIEFLESMFAGGVYVTSFVMVVEIAGRSTRVIFTSVTGIAYGVGGILFGAIASQIRNWRTLIQTIYTPAVIIFLCMLTLDESPRWLLVKGKNLRAIQVIQKAAKWNNVDISKKSMDYLKTYSTTKENKRFKCGNFELSKTIALRLFVCAVIWVCVVFIYYGLTINSVSLAGNKYMNFSLGYLAEILSTILMMISLERFGRKKSVLSSFVICAASCLANLINDSIYLQTSAFFIGKVAITYAFNTLYIYTTELFPTESRNSFLSTCSLIGRIGSILAPQIPLLAFYGSFLPNILFSGVSVLAAFLVLLTPETANTRLPETASEAEDISELKVDSRDVTKL